MPTRIDGRPAASRRPWAGDIFLAGGNTVALAAYCRAGKGQRGLKAAYQALKESFPEANARSLATVIRMLREGIACAKSLRTQRYETAKRKCPDYRPLIRGAKRER
jgi:hypothetical protein